MANFKVGDKVRIKGDLKAHKQYGCWLVTHEMESFCGKVAEIEIVSDNTHYRINIDNHKWMWTDEMLEPAEFTKDCLKDGMIVEWRNGNKYMVLNDRLLSNNTADRLKNFNDDLTNVYIESRDIVKVYNTSAILLSCIFNDNNLTLIWERKKEEPVKEMTVEEIEKILGHKVKVIADEK